jgi:hypothetical protein
LHPDGAGYAKLVLAKIRKIKSMPAATENCPNRTKRVENQVRGHVSADGWRASPVACGTGGLPVGAAMGSQCFTL